MLIETQDYAGRQKAWKKSSKMQFVFRMVERALMGENKSFNQHTHRTAVYLPRIPRFPLS